jgi:5,10-methylenetetrahydromethanopterin reductase
VIARLNTCIAADGKAARDAVRLPVARMLAAGRLKFRTADAQGLTLSPEAIAPFASVHYASGAAPYTPLLPSITDRHVDAFTLAGTIDEVARHMIELKVAGVDGFIIMPFAPAGGSAEDTLVQMGAKVWPQVEKQALKKHG